MFDSAQTLLSKRGNNYAEIGRNSKIVYVVLKVTVLSDILRVTTSIIRQKKRWWNLSKVCRISNEFSGCKVVVFFSLWSSIFLLEQYLRGWTSIISGAVEVKRGLSDSCRFSWRPTVSRHQDPSPNCRSESGACLH